MVESGESFDIIYTDFSKAFDCPTQEIVVKTRKCGHKRVISYIGLDHS